MIEQVDVLVVGAGPAGAVTAASIRKARPDWTVLVADRATFPRDKVCGDGLGPGVIRTLKSLGLEHLLDDVPRPMDVRVSGPDGLEGHARGPIIGGKDLSGAVLPRVEFDDRLVKYAVEEGADLRQGWKLAEMAFEDSGALATFRDGHGADGEHQVRARVVVGADGAYSAVRRLAGSFAPLQRKNTHVAMRAYVPLSDPSVAAGGAASLRLDFTEELLPAYGWVFPEGNGRANIGVGIPITLLDRDDRSLQDLFSDYVKSLKNRGFEVGELENVKSHQLPHAGGMTRFTSGRVALAGDAASMINPVSGEGIFYGMAAGAMLADALATVNLADTQAVVGALRSYESAFRRRFSLHLISCQLAHVFLRSRVWARMVIKAASRNQKVMTDAALLLFDEQRMQISTGFRILLHGL